MLPETTPPGAIQLEVAPLNDKLVNDMARREMQEQCKNEYLKKYGKFSSKDFRTWMANVQYLSHLQEFHKEMKHITEGERKKVVSETVKKTAEELHHTPAICRKSYINQQLISDYIMKGDVVKGEKGFIAYLEKRCKK